MSSLFATAKTYLMPSPTTILAPTAVLSPTVLVTGELSEGHSYVAPDYEAV